MPPFSGAAGVVMIGGENVAISDFSFSLGNPRRIQLAASGLPVGAHMFDVEATKLRMLELVSDAAGFEVTGPFTLEAEALASGGLPEGPLDSGTEGVLLNATLSPAA